MQRQQLEALKEAFKIYNKYFELMKREAEKNNAPDDVIALIAMAQLNLAEAKLHSMTVDEYLQIARQMPMFIPKEYLLPPFPANTTITNFKNLLDVYDLQQYEPGEVYSHVINFLAQEEDDDRYIKYCEIARDHSLFSEDDPRNFKTRFELLRSTRAEAVDWVDKANAIWRIYGPLPLLSHDERLKAIRAKREELQKLPIKPRGLEIVDLYTRIRNRNKDKSQVKPGIKMLMNHYISSLHAIEDLHKTTQELHTLEEDLRRHGDDLILSLRMAYAEKKLRTLELTLLYHDKSKVKKALQAFSLLELRMIKNTFKNDYISNMIEKLPVYKEAEKNARIVRRMFVARPVAEEVKDKHKKKEGVSQPALTMFAVKPDAAEEKGKEKQTSEPALKLFAAKKPKKQDKKSKDKSKDKTKEKGKEKTKDKSGDKSQKPTTKKKR